MRNTCICVCACQGRSRRSDSRRPEQGTPTGGRCGWRGGVRRCRLSRIYMQGIHIRLHARRRRRPDGRRPERAVAGPCRGARGEADCGGAAAFAYIYIYIYSRAAHVPMHARARGGAGGHLGAGLSRFHPLKLSVCVGVECGGAASRPLPCIYICMIGSGAELAAVTAGRWRGGKGGGAKCRGDTMAMLIHTVSRQIRICMSGSGAVLAAG